MFYFYHYFLHTIRVMQTCIIWKKIGTHFNFSPHHYYFNLLKKKCSGVWLLAVLKHPGTMTHSEPQAHIFFFFFF